MAIAIQLAARQPENSLILEAVVAFPSVDTSLQFQAMHAVKEEQEPLEQGKNSLQSDQIAQALQGDQAAFTAIVDQYSTLMLRTASLIVGDRDIAEDAVQDAFIQAWYHLAELRKTEALRSWLLRIVVNQCISFKRRRARTTAFIRQTLSEQETDLLAQAAEHCKGSTERNWDLMQAIEKLPLKQRVVIVLHYYHGMTISEMGIKLHTSENTLKKRIQAALSNLRNILSMHSEGENTIF